jgi:hypothetical protein
VPAALSLLTSTLLISASIRWLAPQHGGAFSSTRAARGSDGGKADAAGLRCGSARAPFPVAPGRSSTEDAPVGSHTLFSNPSRKVKGATSPAASSARWIAPHSATQSPTLDAGPCDPTPIANQKVCVIDSEGRLIRELTLDPSRNYQPLARD